MVPDTFPNAFSSRSLNIFLEYRGHYETYCFRFLIQQETCSFFKSENSFSKRQWVGIWTIRTAKSGTKLYETYCFCFPFSKRLALFKIRLVYGRLERQIPGQSCGNSTTGTTLSRVTVLLSPLSISLPAPSH